MTGVQTCALPILRVEVYPVAEGLDGDNDAGDELFARQGLKIDREGLDGRPAELPEELSPELEEDPQRLGDGEDDLTVRDIQEQCLPHPLAPLLQAFGMTGRAKAPRLAGKRQQVFRMAVRASDPGEARAGVAAVEILFHYLPDDRPEKTILIRFAPEDCKACTPARNDSHTPSGTGRSYGKAPGIGPCAPDGEDDIFPAHRED